MKQSRSFRFLCLLLALAALFSTPVNSAEEKEDSEEATTESELPALLGEASGTLTVHGAVLSYLHIEALSTLYQKGAYPKEQVIHELNSTVSLLELSAHKLLVVAESVSNDADPATDPVLDTYHRLIDQGKALRRWVENGGSFLGETYTRERDRAKEALVNGLDAKGLVEAAAGES